MIMIMEPDCATTDCDRENINGVASNEGKFKIIFYHKSNINLASNYNFNHVKVPPAFAHSPTPLHPI